MSNQRATASTRWLSPVLLAGIGVGVGDLLIALAGARGRAGESGVLAFYWVGVSLLYGSPAAAALRCQRDRRALVAIALVLVAGTYLVNILNSPLAMSTADELQTLRSLRDLSHTHHLFGHNPLVTDYPRFPGSQIAIVVFAQLTGLDLTTSSLLVIAIGHFVLGIALFVLIEALSGSAVGAFAGVVVYATNPSFLYFDSQVFYESFALPFAILSLALVAQAARSTRQRDRRFCLGAASVLGAVVCVSHHMTSYFLAVSLVVWCVFALVRRRREQTDVSVQLVPVTPAVATVVVASLWYAFVAHAQIALELGPTFTAAFEAIKAVVTFSVAPKKPFSSASQLAAFNDPFALEVIGYLSVAVGIGILLVGLWQLRRRSARTAELMTFGLIALIFPVGLALRLTQASSETSSRSSEFVFIGLAVLAALIVAVRAQLAEGEASQIYPVIAPGAGSSRPSRKSRRLHARRASSARSRLSDRVRRLGEHHAVVGAGALVVVLLLAWGGIVVGQPPYDRVAGTYIVGGDIRSVEPLGAETAAWAEHHWPVGTKFAADPVNIRLIASLGDFTPEQGVIDGVPVNHLFLSSSVDSEDFTILEGDKIRYVVVDRRLTELPSASGPAFGASEPGVKVLPSTPVPVADFAKFSSAGVFSRVYDDGAIRIYSSNLP